MAGRGWKLQQEGGENVRRYLVIARGSSAKPGEVVQIQK